ncbi:MAG: SMC-Scp complex subunit ScpB [Candidatus Omnitrophica bacterium]|nr:SMC-Scp complex subunit ScpB [Candidatus Omnitrophota bacterium]
MEDLNEQQATNTVDEQLQHIKGVVESLLFVNERPVTMDQMKKVLETVGTADIKKAIKELQDEQGDRRSGIMIVEIAGGYQMLSNPIYASYLRNFYKTKHKEKLSKPALESMAIIAYKQPVTRSDIELIRGVNSDGVVAHLLNKELIKAIGRKDVPGRPYVYGTTKQFLEYFGLKSVDDLPILEEFPTLQPAAESDIIPIDEEEETGEAPSTEDLSTETEVPETQEAETEMQADENIQEEPEAREEDPQEEEPQNINIVEGINGEEPVEVPEELTEELTEDLIGTTQEQDVENEPEESAQKN